MVLYAKMLHDTIQAGAETKAEHYFPKVMYSFFIAVSGLKGQK